MSKAKEYLWKKITDKLAGKIASGGFHKTKFPTLSEICSQYSVSEITARRAIAELASLNLIKKSTKTGSSVIKEINSVKEIFLIAPEEENRNNKNTSIIYNQITQGIIEEAAAKNIRIKIVSSNFIINNLGSLKELNLIVPAFGEDILFEKLSETKTLKKKIVKYHSINKDKNYSTVRSDLKTAACMAMKYLLEKGHKKIAFITEPNGQWFVSRFEGYAKMLSENGIALNLHLIKGAGKGNYQETAAAMKDLMSLKEPPTAVFAATDLHALDILTYCKSEKIKVPQKLAVCGFDNLPETEFYIPALTTVDTNWKNQGKEAVRLFMNEDFINGKIFDIKTKPEFIIRKSS